MFKKIKIIVMVLCLTTISFSSTNAMKKIPKHKIENINNKLKEKINNYLKILAMESITFQSNWYSYIFQCRNKDMLEETDIDNFVGLYIVGVQSLFLNKNKDVDEEKFLKHLAEYDTDFLNYKLEKEDKENLRKAFLDEVEIIEKALNAFCEIYGKYKKILYKKIFQITKKMDSNNAIDVGVFWYENTIKNLIKNYLKSLSKISSNFENLWDNLLNKYKNQESLSDTDLNEFVNLYYKFVVNIFLDQAGNVDEQKFFEKFSDHFDDEIYKYELKEKDKENLKKAYNTQIKILNNALEKFYNIYKNEKENLIAKINQKNSSNININLTQTAYKNIMKSKIENYLKILPIASNKFKKSWNTYLLQFEKQEKLLDSDINNFAEICLKLAKYIFLDKNNNIDEEGFLKKLSNYDTTTLNYKLDNEDKEKLKTAFNEQIEIIKAHIEKFCEIYKDDKENLIEKINQKINFKINPKTSETKNEININSINFDRFDY